jgi:hypothetical protein
MPHAHRTAVLALLITLILGLAVPGVPVHTARAQDDDPPGSTLTEEQVGWLQRIHEAVLNRDSLANYSMTFTGTSFTTFTLRLSDDTLTGSQSESWQHTQTVFPGDPANILAAITSTSSTLEFVADAPVSYGLLAEARLVDGILYVNATPLVVDPGTPDVPEGWIIVDNPADYSAFSSLRLDDLLDEESIFYDLDTIVGMAEDVIWQPVTLADGTPADQITVTFNLDLIFTDTYGLSDEQQARWRTLFDSAAHLETTIRATMVIDQNDLPVRYASELVWQIDGTDAARFFPDEVPAGTSLDLHLESALESAITAVNAPVDPVTAPEEIAESPG